MAETSWWLLEFQGKIRYVIDMVSWFPSPQHMGTFLLIFDIPNSLQYQTESKTEFSLSYGDSSVQFYSKYSKMINTSQFIKDIFWWL